MFGVRATILTTREAAFYHLIAIVRRGGPSDQEIPYVPLLCELAEIPPDQRACYNALSSRPYRLSANPMARCIFSTTSPTPAPTVRSRSSHLCPRADPARRASPVRHQMPLVRRGPRLRIFPAHGARPYELRLTRGRSENLRSLPVLRPRAVAGAPLDRFPQFSFAPPLAGAPPESRGLAPLRLRATSPPSVRPAAGWLSPSGLASVGTRMGAIQHSCRR
jgi:hypothetical protein